MQKNTAFQFAAMASLLSALSPLASAQIAITPSSLGNFTSTVGNASAPKTLTLNATGPSGAIVVTAPVGFEVSTNPSAGFDSSITFLNLDADGEIQSVYNENFSDHTGKIWSTGSGSEFPNENAYAVVTGSGAVSVWGYSMSGGELSVIDFVYNDDGTFSPTAMADVSQYLSANVTRIYSNNDAFAALKQNGEVVTWGFIGSGGNASVIVNDTKNGEKSVREIASVADFLASDVKDICSNTYAFAALKNDGSVVTWGELTRGGNSTLVDLSIENGNLTVSEGTSVADLISSSVQSLYSNREAFAAVKEGGSVVTWGHESYGGNSTSVASSLGSGVNKIYSTAYGFAALKNDGSVVAWGSEQLSGDAASRLTSGVVEIYSNSYAFAALKNNGSVVTWGAIESGGNSTIANSSFVEKDGIITDGSEARSVAEDLSEGVSKIYSNGDAFAALKNNASVVAWGNIESGGNSTIVLATTANGSEIVEEKGSVAAHLSSDVEKIVSNRQAFAAIKDGGSVVTWGDIRHGGNASITRTVETEESGNYTVITTEVGSVATALSANVTVIYSNDKAFAALRSDGSVVAWGDIECGGNMTKLEYLDGSWNLTETESVADKLSSGVVKIFSNARSFAALKSDGSIVSWGHNSGGYGPSGLPTNLYVRMEKTSQEGAISGNLTFSTLGAEIERVPLSGSFTGSSDSGGNSGGSSSGAPSGGDSSQVQKSKKGKGKSSSANKSSGGSKKSSAKKSSGGSSKKDKASKSSSKKKSGGSKKSKK